MIWIYLIYFLYLILAMVLSFILRSQIHIYSHRGDASHLVEIIYATYIGVVIFFTIIAIVLNYAFNL